METQSRVLAMLNKTKEVREARQENLGAIEDAINEVKSNASTILNDLQKIKDNLYSDLDDAISKILAEADYMSTLTYESDFNSKFEEYNIIVDELKSLNIDFDTNEVDALKEDMNGLLQASNKVSSLNETSFL
jgi:hypothetical protein